MDAVQKAADVSAGAGRATGTGGSWLLKDTWSLRVCLDTISWALDLPLQGVERCAHARIHRSWSVASKAFAEQFPTAESFADLLSRLPDDAAALIGHDVCQQPCWRDLLEQAGEGPWLDVPSYAGPLIRSFRRNWQFRLWEYLHFLKRAAAVPDSACCGHADVGQAPGRLRDLVGIGVFHVVPLDLVLYAYPVTSFRGPGKNLGEHSTMGSSLVEWFNDVFREGGDHVSHHSLARFENIRAGITRDDLRQRLDIAGSALTTIAGLSPSMITSGGWELFPFGRPNLQRIAEAVVFIEIMSRYGQIAPLLQAGHDLIFNFRLLGTSPTITPKISARVLEIRIEQETELRRVSILAHDRPFDVLEAQPQQTGEFLTCQENEAGARQPLDTDQQRHLDLTYSWVLDSIQTRRNAHDFETFLLHRTWLVDNFTEMSDVIQSLIAADDRRGGREVFASRFDLPSIMARNIGLAAGADIACLLRYEYNRNEAVLFGLHQGCTTTAASAADLRQFQQELSAAAGDPRRRRLSIIYRCVDTGQPQVCFAFDPQSANSDPPDSPLLTFPEDTLPLRSANVSPINVRGRPWGAIAIFGLRPYQFPSSAARAIDDLADLVGFIFFSSWTMKHLDLMNQAATERSLHVRARYFALCWHVSRMLLAESVVLWVRDPDNNQRMYAAGWADRPDLDALCTAEQAQASDDELLRQQQMRICFDLSDLHTVTGRLLHDQRPTYKGRIGEGWLRGRWLSKPYSRKLPEMGFTTGYFIPLRFGGETIGSLSLFGKHGVPYDHRWEEAIASVAQQLAITLQGILERDEFKRRRLGIINHEITPLVNTLLRDRLAVIDGLIRSAESLPGSDLAKLRLKINDVRNTLLDIQTRLVHLAENTNDENALFEAAALRAKRREATTYSIVELFHELSARAREKYRHKMISFSGSCPSRLPHVCIDRNDMRIVLENFIENAAKYCSVHETIRFGINERGKYLEVFIINAGPMLEGEEEDQIWTRGTRGTRVMIQEIPGHGLGLYYVMRMAEIYDIEVDHSQSIISEAKGTAQHRFSVEITPKWLKRV
ncbi:putative Histidine kinase [uncultured Defluviicoccus sp.]|uniref:histidine kinase n=1 Tax=metagenome TaxID=256318 RepID=A0A380TF42_9ZZZZ|nr:putative Histidine kinase [uncultured Defluviicoccus sp.]